MLIKHTKSLCRECQAEVPASIEVRNEEVWISKHCEVHGHAEAMIEHSYKFWQWMFSNQSPEPFLEHFNVCVIPVTDRCNLKCPHCYHVPKKSSDPSISEILSMVGKVKPGRGIILMGAEPTMRDDLPRVVAEVRKLGRAVHIYTNGVRLADPNYVRRLKVAGIHAVCFSLHTKHYVSGWQEKIEALKNLEHHEVYVDNISFTMDGLETIDKILDNMQRFWHQPNHFILRVPAPLGRHRGPSSFLSEVVPNIYERCEARSWKISLANADNNPYHLVFDVNDKQLQVIRWPDIDEVDLSDIGVPTCMFFPDLGEISFICGALLLEAERSNILKVA